MNTKIIKQLFLATTALVFTACSEHLLEQTYSSSKGRSATVQLNISTAEEQGEAPATKAIQPNSVTEGTVSDFWLLEYGADGKLLQADGKPVVEYFTKEELIAMNDKLNIQLPNEGSNDSYKCVMIANTHNKSFFDRIDPSQYETLENLKKLTKDVTSINDTYNYDTQDLSLSCVINVNKSTTKLECMFYRNVAKLTFSVENKVGSGMKITGIEVCNVPNKIAYADRLYDGGTDKMASGAELFNLEQEPIEINEGDRHSFIYYLPRNCQGVDNGITDVKKKNKSDLHKSATCVKVYATENSTLNPYCYTFYLGENMTNDFNVRSNWHYTLPINISTPGDADSDSRVEDLGAVKLEANCIMMNLNARDKEYIIYPHKRINKYWGELEKDPDRTIKDDSEWEAVIVWQDTNDDVIEFVESGKETFDGKGKQPLKIKLKNPTSPCNVLIGVKKKGVAINDYGYLWSWHLWVTPYRPERTKPWENGRYDYNDGGVLNGHVYRYAPGYAHLNLPHNTLWDESNGEYKDKYIMDRNLGATTYDSPGQNSDLKKSSGLQYQFGRKDPFVVNGVTLYKTAYGGSTVPKDFATEMNMSVKYPYQFYKVKTSEKYWDWIVTNPYSDNLWNNPFPSEKEFKKKSFFDPCPEGWRVPVAGTWNICLSEDGGVTLNAKESHPKGWDFYIGNGATTFYPSAGYYDENGVFNYGNIVGSNVGSNWSSTPFKDKKDESHQFNYKYGEDYSYGYISLLVYRSYSSPVRCVQE